MRFVSPTGWARFAWQSDYTQFYLVDAGDEAFFAPDDITPEMMERSWVAPDTGLVIYTADCLHQQIRIELYPEEPDHPEIEEMSGKPWTRVEAVAARFPSRKFTISSPSAVTPVPGGPWFFLDAEAVTGRVFWMEFQGSRDESVPVEPDVIRVVLWP